MHISYNCVSYLAFCLDKKQPAAQRFRFSLFASHFVSLITIMLPYSSRHTFCLYSNNFVSCVYHFVFTLLFCHKSNFLSSCSTDVLVHDIFAYHFVSFLAFCPYRLTFCPLVPCFRTPWVLLTMSLGVLGDIIDCVEYALQNRVCTPKWSTYSEMEYLLRNGVLTPKWSTNSKMEY